jgi:hypothetical protein
MHAYILPKRKDKQRLEKGWIRKSGLEITINTKIKGDPTDFHQI